MTYMDTAAVIAALVIAAAVAMAAPWWAAPIVGAGVLLLAPALAVGIELIRRALRP
ncbi:hypothetical protein Hthe01_00980 [Hydrogenophilus thermoluteolus]|uniref:hypothetical protein n=1 Tax=Hydrogenophilus thermoluteolus TaxID=297 RepID=UPI0024A59060|nr:hypothetical protein [Hydrogenophilus thermoluteolus]GLW59749.1 hypothetical protein Hthe01_00980 [Hydrogenophilus thermoluteolus]